MSEILHQEPPTRTLEPVYDVPESPTLEFPDAVDKAAVDAAKEALADAPVEGDTLALVSGGHDSLTAAYIAYCSRLGLDGIVHVNTGIGIPATRAFVRETARQLGIEFHEVGAPTGDPFYPSEYRYVTEEYVHLIQEYGFPGPAAHKWMYLNLKEKPLERWLNEQYPDRELTLVSGVRRHESDDRMENVDANGIQEYLGAVTISPIVEFTGLDVTRFRSGLGLPSNPVVEKLEMSGECLCGAYSSRGELRSIREWFRDVYRYICCLEAKVGAAAATEDGPDTKYARWGHNRLQERERKAMDDSGQMLLCSSCEQQNACDSAGDGCEDGGEP